MERTKNAHSKTRIKTIDTLRTIIVYAVALISQSLNRHVLESGALRRSIPIAVTIYSVCIVFNQLYIVRYRIIYNFKRNGKVHFMTLSLSNFLSTIGTKHYYRTTPQTNIGDHLFWNCREIHDKKIRLFPFSATGWRSPQSQLFLINPDIGVKSAHFLITTYTIQTSDMNKHTIIGSDY